MDSCLTCFICLISKYFFIRGISTNRGWIKKIRFGPGKGNMKILVLFNDGVDVWDVKDVSYCF